MAKITKNRRLGLSFGSEDLFLVETKEETAKNFKVAALLNVTSEIPFSVDMLTQESGAKMIGSELKNLLERNNITTKNASISLDFGLGNIIKIPYSEKLSEKELSTHLSWELQQYIDDDIAEYAYDFYKLDKSPPELLLVGTRKKVLEFFREMSRHAGIDLQVVTIDLLSAVNAFEVNYKPYPNEKIALVEIGEQKLVFTLLEGNSFIGYHCVFLDDSVQNDYVNSVLELITLNLKTLFNDYELSTDKNEFDRAYLYRTNTKYSVMEFIEAADQELYMFNPFELVRFDANLQDKINHLADNSEYVEALGLTVG